MEQKERFMPVHIIAAAGIVKNDKNEILMVKTHGDNWVFPGGQVEVGENVIDGVKREIMEETGIEVEVGELFSISSNTCTYPGYNGVKTVPTKIILDFICKAESGEPRPSEENSESKFVPEEQVLGMMESQAYIERFKNYLEYTGRPIYMEYVSKPKFEMRVKRMI
ncbi:MAG: NUDIX hydrolase [Lachnoclostridium sp.]|nr:NUDIX hydrolase [Lachnoclostridium sp.]